MKAMLLAAGFGTRLKPFTEKHPKALAVINGKTLLQRNIEYLASYGFNDITVNAHHFAEQIKEFVFQSAIKGVTLHISDETDEILETGGGLMRAAPFLKGNESFVLMNVDVLTDLNLGKMLQYHREKGGIATLAVSVRSTSRYFLFDTKNLLCGWENLKTGEKKIARNEKNLTRFAFSGIHVIDPTIFSLIKRKGKFSMVDVYLDLAVTKEIYAYNHTGSKFIDAGTMDRIKEASEIFS